MYKKLCITTSLLFTFLYGADQRITTTTSTTSTVISIPSSHTNHYLTTYAIAKANNFKHDIEKHLNTVAPNATEEDRKMLVEQYIDKNHTKYCGNDRYLLFFPTTCPVEPVKPLNNVPVGIIQKYSDWNQNDTLSSSGDECIPNTACWLTYHKAFYCGHELMFYSKRYKKNALLRIPCTALEKNSVPCELMKLEECRLVKDFVFFDGPDSKGNILFCINTDSNAHKIYFADKQDSLVQEGGFVRHDKKRTPYTYPTLPNSPNYGSTHENEEECLYKNAQCKGRGYTGLGTLTTCTLNEDKVLTAAYDEEKEKYLITILTRENLDLAEFGDEDLAILGFTYLDNNAVKKIVCLGSNNYAAYQCNDTITFFRYDAHEGMVVLEKPGSRVLDCAHLAINSTNPALSASVSKAGKDGSTQLRIYKDTESDPYKVYTVPHADRILNIYYEQDKVRIVYHDGGQNKEPETIAEYTITKD